LLSAIDCEISKFFNQRSGAENRALAAYVAYYERHGVYPEYSIGLEGGILRAGDSMDCCAWMVIYNGSNIGSARTATFTLPPAIVALVNSGMELGAADDAVFNTVNAKQGEGTVGHLTRGIISRTSYYEPAGILAFIPFIWPTLYSDTATPVDK
jgi:non-canonical (house-cleaning) NTP pyrophosphatase